MNIVQGKEIVNKKSKSTEKAAALDDAFGAATTAPPPQDQPQAQAPDPISIAPKWLGRKSGASWGFGGRLIQWDNTKEIKLSQVRTEAGVVEKSKELITSLEANIEHFCQAKKEKASDQEIRYNFCRKSLE